MYLDRGFLRATNPSEDLVQRQVPDTVRFRPDADNLGRRTAQLGPHRVGWHSICATADGPHQQDERDVERRRLAPYFGMRQALRRRPGARI